MHQLSHYFIRKLQYGALLAEQDKDLLIGLAQSVRDIPARGAIAAEGDTPPFLPLIVDGWACRYRILENGKRQITSLLLPGDLCEPYGVLPRFMDSSLGALTHVALSRVTLSAIRNAARSSDAIERALWWDLLVATAIDRERIVSLGRRSAVERLSHLLCELHLRLEMVGLIHNATYELPLTQADLGDVLGLSTVHINRSLQELKTTGLISQHARKVTIHDPVGLQQLAFFDAGYLHPRIAP